VAWIASTSPKVITETVAFERPAFFAAETINCMTVLMFKNFDPEKMVFSKPFKQDHAYRMAITPKAFVQTNEVTLNTTLIDRGELTQRATFVANPALLEWFRAIEAKIRSHARAHKKDIFGDRTVADDFIDASFSSCISTDRTVTLRLSKDLIAYDENKVPVSPEAIPKESKVVLIVSPNYVDFGKRSFACKWSVVAVKKVKVPSYTFVEDEPEEEPEEDEDGASP